MFPSDRNCDYTLLGQCWSVSTNTALGVSGCGMVQWVPFNVVRSRMGTFTTAAYADSTAIGLALTIMGNQGAGAFVTRAVNRLAAGSGTLAHGQAVLWDATNGLIYEADAVAASADSPLFMGIVQGMWQDNSVPATPTYYTSNQAVPYGYEFDLYVGGFCEVVTASTPSAGVALVTGASGGALITATTSHIPNIVGYAWGASVSNVAIAQITRSILRAP